MNVRIRLRQLAEPVGGASWRRRLVTPNEIYFIYDL